MDQNDNIDETKMLRDIEGRLGVFGRERGSLIPILQMIQEKYQYLPKGALEIVGRHLEIPSAEVFGVATFYNQFRFHPPGRHPIKVCLGTACHVRGGDIILENFERKLEIKEGETTPDQEFSIEKVACIGCCALAPVALVGETVHGGMAPSKVEGLVLRIEVEKEMRQRAGKKEQDG
ncbi:MAG: NADH-quinone oxidoreductase subunit NuoE [Deltaproteobacteria bacterium]|nr:NADH-quinone oxidoreductase subunit NuoE [Deltaproteobacteria bacterium]MBW2175784.1 NADH-quinone oxidoreductase subunit NuoE [Deltaproteobacteria bacterium]MBW2296918.1 NADH-quinone oxidoreductase subunit NuoE [Deltaproteobacteria bacterium]MBW2611308.1 NADH-quinone oxidoreductase subunit NuoE [Deltaproteobacteria bacterium]MBW2676528.1 NADH-quinone oxidoreductase subunit NuoE [Deltaproteobacteria bacterium]